MRILITGCNGQLGNTLQTLLKTGVGPLGKIDARYAGSTILSVDIDALDIADASAVDRLVEDFKPELIINCAAFTNVNACETQQVAAYAANATGPKNLAIAAKKIGAKLVHVSTDYVFSGDIPGERVETDPCAPKSVYGSTKRQGEEFIMQECDRYFILRTAWLYGKIGHNFVKTILKNAREKGELKVVNDQYGNPTNCEDLAYHILQLAVTEHYGIYHCTNNGICTWYDFACKIVEYAGISCAVNPCTTDEFPTPAKRPAYSALKNRALKNTIGDHMRHWQDALMDYIQNLED